MEDLTSLTSKQRAGVKAVAYKAAIDVLWTKDFALERDGVTIVFDRKPEYVYDKQNNIIGIDALIRAFDSKGKELEIDPHRRLINPPLKTKVNGVMVEDPWAAYKDWLFDNIKTTPNSKGFRTLGTVDTFYSAASDGSIESRDNTYATARTGPGDSVDDAFMRVGQVVAGGGPTYFLTESFADFDTSTIPDTSDISTAILSLYCTADGSATNYDIQARIRDFGATLTTADWVAGASLGALTHVATLATSGLSTSAYNAFTDVAMPANVSKTGNTRLIMHSDKLSAGTTPTTIDYADFSSSEASGTTQDPKLVVTYTTTVTTTQTILGVARVQKAVTQTVLGRGRIRQVVAQTILGKARVTATILQTLLGKARITATTTRTVLGLARIQKAVAQTITGLARITAATAQTIAGRARITATTSRTVAGRATIQNTTSRTVTGLARVQKAVSQTVTGLARITVSTARTITGKSRITASVAQTITGLARITVTTTRTVAGKAAIEKTTTQTITGLANIIAGAAQTILGKARITATTTRTILGLARIRKTVTQTITGLARITVSTTQTIAGRSRISAATTRTVTGLARVTKSVAQTVLGKARITATTTRTVLGVARVQMGTVLQTIAGRARIQVATTRTVTGLARVADAEGVKTKTITGRARIVKGTWYRNTPVAFQTKNADDWYEKLVPDWIS